MKTLLKLYELDKDYYEYINNLTKNTLSKLNRYGVVVESDDYHYFIPLDNEEINKYKILIKEKELGLCFNKILPISKKLILKVHLTKMLSKKELLEYYQIEKWLNENQVLIVNDLSKYLIKITDDKTTNKSWKTLKLALHLYSKYQIMLKRLRKQYHFNEQLITLEINLFKESLIIRYDNQIICELLKDVSIDDILETLEEEVEFEL